MVKVEFDSNLSKSTSISKRKSSQINQVLRIFFRIFVFNMIKHYYFTRLIILILISLSFQLSLTAQKDGELDWWTDRHNWDGHTAWFNMMTTSAAYLGPNALPVPIVKDGLVEQEYSFEFRPEAHISPGDKTYDLYTSFIAPLGGVASFEVFIVPIEYYKLDTNTRNERLARNYNAEGHAGGDFWFGTNIQIVKNKKFPDLMFSAYFKTASGTNLSDARYTDAPAYYFLLTSGKTVDIDKSKNISLRLSAHLGVYIWQTWIEEHSQDDAVAYGISARLQNERYFCKLSFSGYSGYLNNGDRPNVFRAKVGTYNKPLNFVLNYQYGITDFEYQSFGISLIYRFGKINKQ